MEKMPLKFILTHQLSFVMALLYVLQDLINKVSSGTVAVAKKNLRKLLELCNSPLREEDKKALGSAQEKSFHVVSRHLVKEVISPNENVRKEVRSGRLNFCHGLFFYWMLMSTHVNLFKLGGLSCVQYVTH